MSRAIVRIAVLALLLSGCASSSNSPSSADIPAAQAKLQAAITLYGISKGIAEVAVVADPALAPILASVIGTLDPLVARARPALAAPADAGAIEALAATISEQANALTLVAAPVIKVVPAG